MNGRATDRALDWLAPALFGLVVCLVAPLGKALEFGGDEGYKWMKAPLVSRGHPLYHEIWHDQPPLHTELVAFLFQVFMAGRVVGQRVGGSCVAPAVLILLWAALCYSAGMAGRGGNRRVADGCLNRTGVVTGSSGCEAASTANSRMPNNPFQAASSASPCLIRPLLPACRGQFRNLISDGLEA